MGSGIVLRCDNCNKEFTFDLGIGFMFPMVFEELAAAIRNGDYGDEWKEIIESGSYIVPNAEKYLFYCEKCGNWEIAMDASLYEPKDADALKKEKIGIKTVEEWGYVPYVMGDDLKRNFRLLKKRPHRPLRDFRF